MIKCASYIYVCAYFKKKICLIETAALWKFNESLRNRKIELLYYKIFLLTLLLILNTKLNELLYTL